ncbi:hypothetical protein AMATHDRAFT_49758 [Amanita thiersii Skay4041]|uniref:DUF6534 domain-containing protein n=1 Tax=Amanita thiersii Skay4041 TaxID=703135 RepID=A0A2A9NFP7_9AGAR|nr:hypothetical protein AMATHDRAFT_49758 [Amanita thiersii Skay4041]
MVFAVADEPAGTLPPPWDKDDRFFAEELNVPIAGYIWMSFSAVSDVAIAVIMVYSLLKNNMVRRQTRVITIRIVRLVVETGTITAAVNILVLVLIATTRVTGPIFITPMIILSKIYANAMLVLFNNRMTIGGGKSSTSPQSAIEFTTFIKRMDSSGNSLPSDMQHTRSRPEELEATQVCMSSKEPIFM